MRQHQVSSTVGEVAEPPVTASAIEQPAGAPPFVPGIVIGSLVGFSAGGSHPVVTWPGQPSAREAASIVDLGGVHVGSRVALTFIEGSPERPIVLGRLHTPAPRSGQPSNDRVTVEADDDRVVISAERTIVLRCGRASVTLTRDGKILIQGRYVSHRSTGVLRLKGGAVHIN
jgi:hypothetical protein